MKGEEILVPYGVDYWRVFHTILSPSARLACFKYYNFLPLINESDGMYPTHFLDPTLISKNTNAISTTINESKPDNYRNTT